MSVENPIVEEKQENLAFECKVHQYNGANDKWDHLPLVEDDITGTFEDRLSRLLEKAKGTCEEIKESSDDLAVTLKIITNTDVKLDATTISELSTLNATVEVCN